MQENYGGLRNKEYLMSNLKDSKSCINKQVVGG